MTPRELLLILLLLRFLICPFLVCFLFLSPPHAQIPSAPQVHAIALRCRNKCQNTLKPTNVYSQRERLTHLCISHGSYRVHMVQLMKMQYRVHHNRMSNKYSTLEFPTKLTQYHRIHRFIRLAKLVHGTHSETMPVEKLP